MEKNSSILSFKSPQFRKFVWKASVFGVIYLAIACLFQYVIDTGLRKSDIWMYSGWNDIYRSKATADLLILGSSRARVHFSTKVLDQELGFNTYNFGMDGQTFPIQECRYRLFEKYNPRPKYLVISLDIYGLTKKEELFQFEQFWPYLNEPIIRRSIKGYAGSPGFFDLYFPGFKYQSKLRTVKVGFQEFFGLRHYTNPKYKGYAGKKLKWTGYFDKWKREHKNGVTQRIDEEPKELFYKLLEDSRRAGVKVFLVYSPELWEAQPYFLNRKEIMDIYRMAAKKYGAVFIDYSDHPIGSQRRYFYNSQHLNLEGSRLFTKDLATKIKKQI